MGIWQTPIIFVEVGGRVRILKIELKNVSSFWPGWTALAHRRQSAKRGGARGGPGGTRRAGTCPSRARVRVARAGAPAPAAAAGDAEKRSEIVRKCSARVINLFTLYTVLSVPLESREQVI